MKIKPCPKCGCCEYLATAHVTQTWLINQDGDFVESKTECDEGCHRRRCSSLHLISLQALGPLGSGVCFLLQSRYTVSIQKIKITTN